MYSDCYVGHFFPFHIAVCLYFCYYLYHSTLCTFDVSWSTCLCCCQHFGLHTYFDSQYLDSICKIFVSTIFARYCSELCSGLGCCNTLSSSRSGDPGTLKFLNQSYYLQVRSGWRSKRLTTRSFSLMSFLNRIQITGCASSCLL